MSAEPANKEDVVKLHPQRERKVSQCMTETPAQVAGVNGATTYAAAMKCVNN